MRVESDRRADALISAHFILFYIIPFYCAAGRGGHICTSTLKADKIVSTGNSQNIEL